MKALSVVRMVALACVLAAGAARAGGLAIAHDPVPYGVRGQPLTLKAKVSGAAEPKAVTLYYALFRDAAPFRVAMKSTGMGYYVGTIDASLLAGVDKVSYYIEAQDRDDAITETDWYEVEFRLPVSKPQVALPAPTPAGPAAPAPVAPSAPSAPSDGGSWKKPLLYFGGAALALGGAYALSQSGGGDDDEGGGGATNDPRGTYQGTVTRCFNDAAGTTRCDSHGMTILIDANSVVFSETIHPGQQLTDDLNGNAFALTANVDENGTNSVVRYEGVVAGTRIAGQVSGTATSAGGNGSYSGTFTASKQ